jgi:hypothetical protein
VDTRPVRLLGAGVHNLEDGAPREAAERDVDLFQGSEPT